MMNLIRSRQLRRGAAIVFLLAVVGLGLWSVGSYAFGEYHLRRATKELQRQRYRAALKEFESALRFRPTSAQLHLLIGRTARQAGRFPLAWEHLHRCRELQKGVSADLQIEEYMLRAQTGQLEDVFRFLVPHLREEDEYTSLVLETLSHAYLFLYRFDGAWQCLQRWLQLQPENVEALYLCGKYYTLVVKLELAIDSLQKAINLDPTRLDARLLLGESLRQAHHIDEAAAQFELALQQDAGNREARVGLAGCLADNSKWAEAESTLDGISDDNADAELSYVRGRIAEGRGRYEEAIPFFRAAIASRPSDNVSCIHLIQCYQRLGNEAQASESQELLDRIEKDQMRLIAITNKEKDALPSDPALCCELGEVCLRLGLNRRGLHWLQAALYIDPHYRRAHEQLLRYYERLGLEGKEDAAFHRRMLSQ